jgi:hypothetical protein
MIPFRSMVVNHIENHFDAGGMKIAHHRFEFEDLFAQLPAAGDCACGAKNRIVL